MLIFSMRGDKNNFFFLLGVRDKKKAEEHCDW